MGALVSSTRALGFPSRKAIGASTPARIAQARLVSVREPRAFPEASTRPTLPVTISDELVDFYAFVFCQGGFRRLEMTFEQFLLVAAAIKPLDPQSGLEGAVRWGEILR
jgi:hypothetical protein